MIYLQLFLSFLQIGLFSFGGGYAAMPLIQGQVVTLHGWLTMSEFTDLITISQMTPGPIAVNSATFVGMKIAGIPGAVVAMIASAGILILKDAFWGSGESILLTRTEWSMVLIFGICVLLLRKKLNPIWVMVLAGVMKVGISMTIQGICF